MKGSVAVMLLLAESFATRPPPVDVLLTFVADEEDRSLGMDWIVDHWLPGLPVLPFGGLFLEPTELEIGICHKGFAWYEIEVAGKAAHGSRPEEGSDAILPLGAALRELHAIQDRLSRSDPHARLGRPSLHAGTIEGGTALSIIPAHARLAWERRSLPGETEDALHAEYERVLSAVQNESGAHRANGRRLFARAAHEVDENAGIVQMLRQAAPDSKLVGLSFWADSALGGEAGMPSVLFGPVGHGAHAVDEWVSLDSLMRVFEVLQRVLAAAGTGSP